MYDRHIGTEGSFFLLENLETNCFFLLEILFLFGIYAFPISGFSEWSLVHGIQGNGTNRV
jgi:hypothetical protein